MRMYHATCFKNLDSILCNGIRKGIDGIVYLTTKPEDAAKFIVIRGEKKILVVEVEIQKAKLIETFDHNEMFFGCRCFGYVEDIPANKIKQLTTYEL